MRISTTKNTIVLGRNERAIWGATTPDGRDLADARERVREAAEALATRTGRTVDVYAPAEAGGFMVDQYTP